MIILPKAVFFEVARKSCNLVLLHTFNLNGKGCLCWNWVEHRSTLAPNSFESLQSSNRKNPVNPLTGFPDIHTPSLSLYFCRPISGSQPFGREPRNEAAGIAATDDDVSRALYVLSLPARLMHRRRKWRGMHYPYYVRHPPSGKEKNSWVVAGTGKWLVSQYPQAWWHIRQAYIILLLQTCWKSCSRKTEWLAGWLIS